MLGPKDQLGVVAFDGNSYWVSELHSASDEGYIVDRISTIEASGGTSIYPALSDAYDALATATAKLKHVILLTDGHSSPGDFEGIASDMVAARITLSSVAVGQEADQELLEQLAETGGGRYYMCDDPNSVPQIFAKETVEASKSAINELPFVPLLVRPTQVLSGIDTVASGAYHLELSQEQNGTQTFRQTRGVVVGYPDELRLGPPNEQLMQRIASVSGGDYAPTAAQIFNPGDRIARQVIRLWPWLLMGALSIFLLDVALRRIDFSLWFGRQRAG